MSTRHLEVILRLSGGAVVPINYAIVARIDSGLEDGLGHPAAQGIQEVTGASAGVTGGKHPRAMLFEDVLANHFRRSMDGFVYDGAAKGRGERDHRCDVIGPLTGNRARDDPAEAVADDVDLPPGIHQGLFDIAVETPLDQEVGTLGIDADTGKVRTIADLLQPRSHLREINI